MKTNIKLLALPALVLSAVTVVSCSQDEVVETVDSTKTQNREITFHTDILSRATATTNDNIDSIWVYAYTQGEEGTGKEIIPGALFIKDAETQMFSSEKKYYWPETEEVNFVAMYPCPEVLQISEDYIFTEKPSEETIATGDTIIYLVKNLNEVILGNALFKSGNNWYHQGSQFVKDMVVATSKGDKANNEQDGVALSFKHTQSQIEIKAKYTGTDYYVACGAVAVAQIANIGTFDLLSFDWTDKTVFSYASRDGLGLIAESYSMFRSLPVELNSEAQSLTKNVGSLPQTGNIMVIPQQNAAWDPETDKTNENGGTMLFFLLELKKDGEYLFDYSNWSADRKKYSYVIYNNKFNYLRVAVPVEANWEAGKKYIYTVEFSDDALGYYLPLDPEKPGEPILGNPIKVTSVEVADWEDTPEQELVP